VAIGNLLAALQYVRYFRFVDDVIVALHQLRKDDASE